MHFFPGPYCSTASTVPPVLVLPGVGAYVDPVESNSTARPWLSWSGRDGCHPPSNRVQISLDPAFEGGMIDRITRSPEVHWQVDEDLEPEQTYYWRVAETDGVSLGPWSAVRSFHTNPLPTDEQLAVVTGVVWHDLCSIDWDDPAAVQEGCVPGDPYPTGDGVRAEGEPGIPGVVVSYMTRECFMGWDFARSHNVHSPTDADGAYYQYLAPGTYCFAILHDFGNHAILDNGVWTSPETTNPAMTPTIDVTVAEGEVRTGVDFGYDYLLGGSSTPASVNGRVWNDLNGDGVQGAAEHGIYGVRVYLSHGQCTIHFRMGAYLTTLTGPDGSYNFRLLDPGEYCVIVDPLDVWNVDLLINGGWTAPNSPMDASQAVAIDLAQGQVMEGVDFGWYYYPTGMDTVTPMLITPTRYLTQPAPTSTPHFVPPTYVMPTQPTFIPIPPTLVIPTTPAIPQ